jgi:hypothetical protein
MENTGISHDPDTRDAHKTTPSGETGVDDFRDASDQHGRGRVADAAGVRSIDGERHTVPSDDLDDTPTADDPFGTTPDSNRVREIQQTNPGPTYERDQGTADPSTGGSTDPNNFMTHANSGDETETIEGGEK